MMGRRDRTQQLRRHHHRLRPFYLRPTAPSIELLDRVAYTDRLSKAQLWDQAVLFKNEELKKKVKSVIVHVNYHPDKLNRMQAVVEFYVNGKQDALDSLPDGLF
ncbi:hypothetical protein DY000_02057374 [Brassica cretica]|uniref:Uncharacterized protein n=1 Tax=Brassica cretica TaxID=69181 RepID=A0ABQ7A4B9_BRACR|nr:hypothetical protein DY000_02057374 [Brassica cretica]